MWNLWGGLIYLLAPPKTQVVGAEVKVQMAVLAPYYKTGEVPWPVRLINVPAHENNNFSEVLDIKNIKKLEMFCCLRVPFCQGVTTAADWSERRTAPAPWAELEADNIVLTVPSTFVRSIECPDKVMALWRDMMIAVADLAAIPHKFVRKERIVTDVQISKGNCFLVLNAYTIAFSIRLYFGLDV